MLPNLTQGMRGPQVLAVQQGLNIRKEPQDQALTEDGIFGPETAAAVRLFQQRHQLRVDGIVGNATRAALFPWAVVTVRAVGMRLRMPAFTLPGFGPTSDPQPNILSLPPLVPSMSGYQPQSYPGLSLPLATPLLAPPPMVPGLTLPVHHFEVQPGTSVSLGRPVDVAFSLTLSGVVMIGAEEGNHQEFSSGVIMSSPGVFQGGDWTVGWFATLTHVEQLGRSGNWSWQPNAQGVVGHGALPFLSLTGSPATVQFDATKNLSFNFGGPSITALFTPDGASISWGLASFGIIGKF